VVVAEAEVVAAPAVKVIQAVADRTITPMLAVAVVKVDPELAQITVWVAMAVLPKHGATVFGMQAVVVAELQAGRKA
jgi:hypothetical protein